MDSVQQSFRLGLLRLQSGTPGKLAHQEDQRQIRIAVEVRAQRPVHWWASQSVESCQETLIPPTRALNKAD
jgi:hypothetical protein